MAQAYSDAYNKGFSDGFEHTVDAISKVFRIPRNNIIIKLQQYVFSLETSADVLKTENAEDVDSVNSNKDKSGVAKIDLDASKTKSVEKIASVTSSEDESGVAKIKLDNPESMSAEQLKAYLDSGDTNVFDLLTYLESLTIPRILQLYARYTGDELCGSFKKHRLISFFREVIQAHRMEESYKHIIV